MSERPTHTPRRQPDAEELLAQVKETLHDALDFPEYDIPARIIAFILKVPGHVKAWLQRPKKNETPQDVAERAAAFQRLCDTVSQETATLSKRIQALLDQSIDYYIQLGEHPLFQRYHISTQSAVAQLEVVKDKVPKLIDDEAVKQLSDNNPACVQLRRMLPGQEKEQRMQQLIAQVIQRAIQRCAQAVAETMEEVQADLLDALASAQSMQQRLWERQADALQKLLDAQEDPAVQQAVLNQARCALQCCAHIEAQLEEVVSYER